ncbi:MAG: hypothetical protein ACUZ8H_01460 [Candidatus Anammoxibacter sp.]
MTFIIKNKDKDRIAIHAQKAEEKKLFRETTKAYRGHTIFQFDPKTGKLTKANYEDIYQHAKKIWDRRKIKKLVMMEGCLYVSALNEKNAFRKLNKHVDG